MAKTFVGKLLAGIVAVFGSIFHHVMEGAEKTFKELPPATQQALIHGSGVIDLINTMLTSTPAQIRAAIKEKFPDLDEAALETGLFTIAHGFNLAPEMNNLDDTIAKLQSYLKGISSPVWDEIMHGAANILAVILAPAGTKFGAIAALMEYCYQTFIKKDATAG